MASRINGIMAWRNVISINQWRKWRRRRHQHRIMPHRRGMTSASAASKASQRNRAASNAAWRGIEMSDNVKSNGLLAAASKAAWRGAPAAWRKQTWRRLGINMAARVFMCLAPSRASAHKKHQANGVTLAAQLNKRNALCARSIFAQNGISIFSCAYALAYRAARVIAYARRLAHGNSAVLCRTAARQRVTRVTR